ncbi:MAG: hypothetical protein VB852_03770, partial [Deltaproteobacteria bacterium]
TLFRSEIPPLAGCPQTSVSLVTLPEVAVAPVTDAVKSDALGVPVVVKLHVTDMVPPVMATPAQEI